MSFNHKNKVRARKSHRCEWCYNPISKGVVYINNVGVFDGYFFTYKAHQKCFENLYKAYSLYSRDCFNYECTYDYLRERAKDENPELLQGEGDD